MKYGAGRITADDSGYGSLHLFPRFKQESALYRADVLKDVLHQLRDEYAAAFKEAFGHDFDGWPPIGGEIP